MPMEKVYKIFGDKILLLEFTESELLLNFKCYNEDEQIDLIRSIITKFKISCPRENFHWERHILTLKAN